jgi:hypothetical protein
VSDRLALALAELVDALRAEIAAESRPADAAPIELIGVGEFARRASLGRSSAYLGVADGSIRSIKIRGRRLVPASELARLAHSSSRFSAGATFPDGAGDLGITPGAGRRRPEVR